jgi:peroxiredoxin
MTAVGGVTMPLSIPHNVNIVQPGFMAPDFDLESKQGERFVLTREVVRGPLVLNFYGGAWALSCMAMLRKIQRLLPEFAKRGGAFAAVSSESPSLTVRLAQSENFTFPLLADGDLTVAKRYGIWNPSSERPAPFPSFWVIDQDRVIRFKRIILTEKDRPNIDTLLGKIEKYRI